MTFAPFLVVLPWCRTKPDSASRSGRERGRCALESAAARRNRASGLGRYLSVESASCGLGCRALNAIKTCRLELTEKRIWVSSVHVTIFLKKKKKAWVVSQYTPVVLLSHNTAWNAVSLPSTTWLESDVFHQKKKKKKKGRLFKCTVVTSIEGFLVSLPSASGSLRNVAGACAVSRRAAMCFFSSSPPPPFPGSMVYETCASKFASKSRAKQKKKAYLSKWGAGHFVPDWLDCLLHWHGLKC